MNETAHGKELPKPLQPGRRFHRFSTVELLIALADCKGVFFIALVLAIPAIVGRWINHFRPDLVPPPVFLIAGLALIAFVVANLLRFVLRAPSVNTDVLCASISAYLMLG